LKVQTFLPDWNDFDWWNSSERQRFMRRCDYLLYAAQMFGCLEIFSQTWPSAPPVYC
jgi:hypothetical protein